MSPPRRNQGIVGAFRRQYVYQTPVMPRSPIGGPWTAEQLDELRVLLYKGKSLAPLAVHFRHTQNGITHKLRELRLPTPLQVKRRRAEGDGPTTIDKKKVGLKY